MSRKKVIVGALVSLAVILPGCEACNGGITNSSSKIATGIIKEAERICGPDRQSGRGGVENIMLMDGREDDGIVTCHDGTNHYFDA